MFKYSGYGYTKNRGTDPVTGVITFMIISVIMSVYVLYYVAIGLAYAGLFIHAVVKETVRWYKVRRQMAECRKQKLVEKVQKAEVIPIKRIETHKTRKAEIKR